MTDFCELSFLIDLFILFLVLIVLFSDSLINKLSLYVVVFFIFNTYYFTLERSVITNP